MSNQPTVKSECKECGALVGVTGNSISREYSEQLANTIANNHCGGKPPWGVSKKVKKKVKVDMNQYKELEL